LEVNSNMLSLENVSVSYGKTEALHNVSLQIKEGEVVALLGANGAGKTTLLNMISGFLKPDEGRIKLKGVEIHGNKPYSIFRQGIVQVSQARDLFTAMTVKENLELGAVISKDDFSSDLIQVLNYFPRLHERQNQRVGTLSGGEQQMVAIGRALMGRPKVLLLDEPSGGLAPRFVSEIARIMRTLKEKKSTMLIVEQNIALALNVADRFYIVRDGHVVRSGVPADLGSNYLDIAKSYYL
jgi:branched-chain amino acid transport system ATP-binding protein